MSGVNCHSRLKQHGLLHHLCPSQKIHRLCTSEFQPYVVLVKPPRIEELRLTRRRAKFICGEEDKSSIRIFSVRQTTTSAAGYFFWLLLQKQQVQIRCFRPLPKFPSGFSIDT